MTEAATRVRVRLKVGGTAKVMVAAVLMVIAATAKVCSTCRLFYFYLKTDGYVFNYFIFGCIIGDWDGQDDYVDSDVEAAARGAGSEEEGGDENSESSDSREGSESGNESAEDEEQEEEGGGCDIRLDISHLLPTSNIFSHTTSILFFALCTVL